MEPEVANATTKVFSGVQGRGGAADQGTGCRPAGGRDLDVHENVLRKWVKEFSADPVQAFPGQGQMKTEQLEIERLRREVTKLRAERDILKKATAFFATEIDMKFMFIAKHRSIWPVAWMCEALAVSRSGFHAWLTRRPSRRAKTDEALGAKVRASFIGSARTYGARRVWRDVLAEGVACGLHKMVIIDNKRYFEKVIETQ